MTSSGEESITQDWLETVVVAYVEKTRKKSGGGAPVAGTSQTVPLVEDYEIEALDSGDNVMSDLLAIRVTFSVGGRKREEARLVAKLLPQDPVSRFAVQESKFDEREISFYQRLVPDLQAFQQRSIGQLLAPAAPVCYHAKYKPDCESILVLEDLRASGYQVINFSECLTEARARSALTEIARLHAVTFAMRVRDGVDLLGKYKFLLHPRQAASLYDHFLGRGLPHLIDFLKGLQNDQLADIITRLKTYVTDNTPLFYGLVTAKSHLSVVTHNDFWCNNLMFREEADGSTSCKIIDWQLAQVSTPTNDVALLLLSSLSPELRRGKTAALLQHYWTELSSAAARFGVSLETEYEYSQERLEQDYRRSRKLALLLCAGSLDVTQSCQRREQRLLSLLKDMYAEGVF